MRERPFVGRTAELERLDALLQRASARQGAIALVCGEPGIGKSRLVEELANGAQARGFDALWGRCWEGGGAPAFWPWIQILRALLRLDEPAMLDARSTRTILAQLLPELGVHDTLDRTGLSPDQARFALLDAVTGLLHARARVRPVLLVLEDLHAADPSSVQLLDFLARSLPGTAIAIVGTLRETDARATSSWPTLSRLLSTADSLPLRRLEPEGVRDCLSALTGRAIDPRSADAVVRLTEGNPLFVTEAGRLLSARGDVLLDATDLPDGVLTMIEGRLRLLDATARSVLEAAAILGREFEAERVGQLLGQAPTHLVAAWDRSCSADLLEAIGPARFRFAHVLYREALLRGLSGEARRGLHATAAAVLRRTADPPWSEIAHHLFEAAPGDPHELVEASLAAAGSAVERLAFDDATQWYERALPYTKDAERAELLLALGHAHMSAGNSAAGRRACLEAASWARERGDAAMLGRAALGYGARFVFASVDGDLVHLLAEARDALREGPLPWRARVMARLAAAMQPALPPTEPIELAREAIALARQTDDPKVLLATIRDGCSAMMDLADPKERRRLNFEHVALAERLGDRVEQLRGHVRSVFDAIELGDATGTWGAIASAERIAESLGHPHHRWTTTALQAMRAQWEGEFDRAEALNDEALKLGQRARDPNAPRSLFLQRLHGLSLQGRYDELLRELPQLTSVASGLVQGHVYARILGAGCLARSGRVDAARAHLHDDDIEVAFVVGDRWLLTEVAELALASADRELAGRLIPCFEAGPPGGFVSGGAFALTMGPPLAYVLGRLLDGVGRRTEADATLDLAIEQSDRAHGRSWGAWARLARARDARALEDVAASAANMPGLLARCRITAPAPVPSQRAAPFSLRRDGEVWTLEHGDRSFVLKDVKGLQILATLVAEPGREFHVLDLVDADPQSTMRSTGDAGPLLDDQARRAYAARVAALREELEEAEQWNDDARAERLRSEIEAIGRELSRAFGLGGRTRKAGSAVERARINVQRRLKDALRRIEEHDQGLAARLGRDVRTGTYCSYEPL